MVHAILTKFEGIRKKRILQVGTFRLGTAAQFLQMESAYPVSAFHEPALAGKSSQPVNGMFHFEGQGWYCKILKPVTPKMVRAILKKLEGLE